MPVSPGVEHAFFRLLYENDKVGYETQVYWTRAAKWLAKQIPEEQLLHRSRIGTIAFRPLQVTEDVLRTERVNEWVNTGKFDSYRGKASVMYELFDMMMEETIKYLEYDEDWIRQYIAKHENSSVGGGLKWRDLLAMSQEEWMALFETIKKLAEDIRAHPGMWVNLNYRTGLRARSDKLDRLGREYYGMIERTRVVAFYPLMSMWNAFIKNKKELFLRIFQRAAQILRIPNRVLIPFTEGGRIYSLAAELFHEYGDHFSAQDGKSWEASVGIILGEAFSAFYVLDDGLALLPSGIWCTSILGTLASLVVLAVQHPDTVAILLGDDQNLFGPVRKPSVPWIEEDPGDTKHKLILGMGYGYEYDRPRVFGLKAQSDRADKALPITLEPGVFESVDLSGRHSVQERAAWIGAYLGFYGGRSLIEAARSLDLTKYDYISPSVVIQDLTDPDTFESDFNPLAYLDYYGSEAKREVTNS